MTTAASATAGPAAPAHHRPGFHHLLLSEWTKIRSVRSTVWSLILLVVLDLGLLGSLYLAYRLAGNRLRTFAPPAVSP